MADLAATDTLTLAEGDNQTKQTSAIIPDITFTEETPDIGIAGTDTFTLTETGVLEQPQGSDTFTLTEVGTLVGGSGPLKTASDTLTLAERQTKLQISGTYGAALAEEVPDIGIPATDSGALGESGQVNNIAVTDDFTLTETVYEGPEPTWQRTGTETFTLAESVALAQAVTETGTLSESASLAVPFGLADTLTLGESASITIDFSGTDTFTLGEASNFDSNYSGQVTGTVSIVGHLTGTASVY